MVPNTTSFLSELISARAADLLAWTVRRSLTGEHRPFSEPRSCREHQSSREGRSSREHLRHDDLVVAYETLYLPNDAGNDLQILTRRCATKLHKR